MFALAILPKCPICLMAWGGILASAGLARLVTNPMVAFSLALLSLAIVLTHAIRRRDWRFAAVGVLVVSVLVLRRFG
ncbi:MAG TPA: hypothetical protein VKU85_21595 [bacterium]|nr:hypothetical protein [bacterium]